jgi:hypothetical protein
MRAPNRRLLVGGSYFVLGAGALVLAGVLAPSPPWAEWALFAGAFALLSYWSVEVNDRMFISSSVMAMLTGGVVFAIENGSAVLGMALVAAAGPLVPDDLRQRRIFQPAFNFGQLTLAGLAAGLALQSIVGGMDRNELSTPGSLARVALAGAAAALVYTSVNIGLVRLGARLVYGMRNLLPWSQMTSFFSSQIVMGLLGGLLGSVFILTGVAVLPLVVAVYLVGNLVYSSHAQLREAHESTLRGFVKTLEARDLYTRGHTERVAYFCQLIGEQLRFRGTQLERMRWAALIHDVGKLAVPIEIMTKHGKLDDEEYRAFRVASHKVDDLLSGVDFLRPMVDVASGCHPRLQGEDFGQTGHVHTRQPTLEQQVLAVADAFDAMTSTRPYRMALAHDTAIRILREDDDPLFGAKVVDALARALERVGERYGPPDLDLAAGSRSGRLR